MAFTYEIADGNIVNIYADGNGAPVLVQDLAPTGKPWKDKAEAEKWAKAYLNGIDERIAEGIAQLEAMNKETSIDVEETPAPTE